MSKNLTGWTERHGLEEYRDGKSFRLLVTLNTRTAHVMARPDKDHWDSWVAYRNGAVTACDLYFEGAKGEEWNSPGIYDSTDVRNVLDNVLELPSSEVSFKKVCGTCLRVTKSMTGTDLMSEKGREGN